MDSENYRGYAVKIMQEEEASESPRDGDNAGTMVCFHNRYTLGDKTDFRSGDFSSWEELKAAIFRKEGRTMIFPLFLYDHSGLRMKIGSYQGMLSQGHAEFDSGCVGYIYISYNKIRKEWGKKGGRLSQKTIRQAEKCLRQEVETYDQYLGGDVWYFTAEKDGVSVDSCGGLYGYAYALQYAHESVDASIKAARSEHCRKPEDKNNFKKRIVGTIPGIDFPEDFDALPEAEKQARLDKAIAVLQ